MTPFTAQKEMLERLNELQSELHEIREQQDNPPRSPGKFPESDDSAPPRRA
jgi:hypothetical protein